MEKEQLGKIKCQSCGKEFGIDEAILSWDFVENELFVGHERNCDGKHFYETYAPEGWTKYYWEKIHREP